MERFHFTKPMMARESFATNLVFVNARGEKLSIAGDNSHIASIEHTVRHSYAIFDAKGETIQEDTHIGDANELTRVIAKHMGFELV